MRKRIGPVWFGILVGLGWPATPLCAQSSPLPAAPAADSAPPAGRPEPPKKDFRNARSYPVLSVESSGLIRLGPVGSQKRVRLLGLEAVGKDATRLLEGLLKGKSVYVEHESARSVSDAEDRAPVYLFRAPDGLFINLELVARGFARTATKTPFRYTDLFLDREREASRRGLGLWSPDRAPTADARATSPGTASSPTPRRRPKRSSAASTAARIEAQRELDQAIGQMMQNAQPPDLSPPRPSLLVPPVPPTVVITPPYFGLPYSGPVIQPYPVPVPVPGAGNPPSTPLGAPGSANPPASSGGVGTPAGAPSHQGNIPSHQGNNARPGHHPGSHPTGSGTESAAPHSVR